MPDLVTLRKSPCLPWACDVEAIVPNSYGRWYIMTRRESNPCFVVHQYDPQTGDCAHGSYVETRERALQKLFERAGVSN